MPGKKFTSCSDGCGIGEYLAEFELLVSMDEWSDQKVEEYLAVLFEGDAKVFCPAASHAECDSYKMLCKHFKHQYAFALLKGMTSKELGRTLAH